MNETCENCRYFNLRENPPVGFKPHGGCRRNAPTINMKNYGSGYWPIVNVEDWCGEWKAKDAQTVDR